MGCVVLYVNNGPYGLHTYQENKKVRIGLEYAKLCGGSGRFGRFARIKVGGWYMYSFMACCLVWGLKIIGGFSLMKLITYHKFFAHTRHW